MEILLSGAGGEPVDLLRTFLSHGVADLPPLFVDSKAPSLTLTICLGRSARTVTITAGREGYANLAVHGPKPSQAEQENIIAGVRHILRLDDDLSGFYRILSKDLALSWAATGAGRMIRSQTVFEDVVKTICTTNCSWSATERMVGALVLHLGVKAKGSKYEGAAGRAFPTPEAMANADLSFYREVVRAGYRGAYLKSLAEKVCAGEVDLDRLAKNHLAALNDDQVEKELLKLPGVGPYAAAHIMMMLGRYSRLIFDSWTRPKYARLVGKENVPDEVIQKRFKRYGDYAGLAFWLFLTRDWVGDPSSERASWRDTVS